MTEPVTCDECIWFRRDDINPKDGLGWCALRNVSRYPMAPHYCRQRRVEDDSFKKRCLRPTDRLTYTYP